MYEVLDKVTIIFYTSPFCQWKNVVCFKKETSRMLSWAFSTS